MRAFRTRRLLAIVLTGAAGLLIMAVAGIASRNIGHTPHASGWTLFAVLVFLALYNVRKAVPFLPLGSASAWLQLHIYGGLLTSVLFSVHVGFRIPDGVFESLLTTLYLTVFLSGLCGLYMTRSFPARLTMLGHEVIFEQIPVVRCRLRDSIEALVLVGNAETDTSVIADFYRHHIRPYMDGHHDLTTQLTRGTSAQWHRLSRAIDDQNRYLDDEERRLMNEVKDLIHRKFRLDTQYALQGALKLWLFIHVPVTWALLIFATLHSMLVHAWSGGLP